MGLTVTSALGLGGGPTLGRSPSACHRLWVWALPPWLDANSYLKTSLHVIGQQKQTPNACCPPRRATKESWKGQHLTSATTNKSTLSRPLEIDFRVQDVERFSLQRMREHVRNVVFPRNLHHLHLVRLQSTLRPQLLCGQMFDLLRALPEEHAFACARVCKDFTEDVPTVQITVQLG